MVNVDDTHWAEPTLLDLLDRVREETRHLPLLLVCQARPELLQTRPGWIEDSADATSFELEPFDAALTASSVAAILGPGVPSDVADAVGRWSGGTPLFVEEIVGHLVESGLLRHVDGGWVRTGDLDAAGVPATVSALIAARLDRLPDDERRVLEYVSVVGLEATAEQAALLIGEDPTRLLDALAGRDLLRRTWSSSGELWAFRHVLIRDAAYDALPKAERTQLHLRLADHLEGRDDAGGENDALLAHHLGRAATYAVALTPTSAATRDLVDRAGRAFGAAADLARQRDDYAATVALLDMGVGLPTRGRLRRTLLVQLVQAFVERFESAAADSAMELLERALDDPDEPADELEREHARLVRSQSNPTSGTPVRALASRVAALAEERGDRRRQAMAVYCTYTFALVELQSARFEAASAVIDRIGDVQDRRVADRWRGAVIIYGPRPITVIVDYAQELLDTSRSTRALAQAAICHQMGLVARGEVPADAVLSVAEEGVSAYPDDTEMYVFDSMAALVAGRHAEGSRILETLVALLRDFGDTTHGSTYILWQALASIDAGADPMSVVSLVDEGESWTTPDDPMSLALLHAARALLFVRQGELDEALEHARVALATLADTDALWVRAEVGRWCSAIYRELGDRDAERALLLRAREDYATKRISTWDDWISARLSG